MKIVFVSSFFGSEIGGAEISAKLLRSALEDRGHDVYALTTRKVKVDDGVILIPRSDFIPKKLITLGNTLFDKFLAKKLNEQIKWLKPDILHVQDTYILPATILANKKLRFPVVATVRNNMSDYVYDLIFSFPVSTLLKRRNKVILNCLKQANGVISVSNYIKRELLDLGVESESVYQIYAEYSSWSMREQKNEISRNDNCIVLLAPGRLVKYKGFRVLIKAMNLVTEKEKKVKLIVAGEGPDRKALEKLTEKYGLNSFINFIGKIPHEEIMQYYCNSDIVVFPSIHPEPFGRIALEAMSLGKPVIASKVGGIPEIVDDFKSGLLVPPGDHEKLAEAIMFLTENRQKSELMGKEGILIAHKRFDPNELIKKHLEVYQAVIKSHCMDAV